MSDRQETEVVSPCIGVCAMNEATGFCHGCFRTIDEIKGWWEMPATQRERVMQMLEARLAGEVDFGD
jgi:uncharacterized protein